MAECELHGGAAKGADFFMGLMRALGGIGSRGTLSGVCGNVCGRVGWCRYWCGRTARMQISVGFMCSAPDVVVGQDGLGFCGRGFWGGLCRRWKSVAGGAIPLQ